MYPHDLHVFNSAVVLARKTHSFSMHILAISTFQDPNHISAERDTRTHTHIHIRITLKHTSTDKHACTHKHSCAHTHTHMHTCTHLHLHAHAFTHTHTGGALVPAAQNAQPQHAAAQAAQKQREIMRVIEDKGNSSAAVSRRLASKWPKPAWHPPWKL
jgi:hypothetical protein